MEPMKTRARILPLLALLLISATPLPRNEDEALFLRRINAFWTDKEYVFAKSEIWRFLEAYPDTPLRSRMHALLGDISLSQNLYQEALGFYSNIRDPEEQRNVRLHRLYALYQLKEYKKLQEELGDALHAKSSEEERFYYAESCFRQALQLALMPEKKTRAKLLAEEAIAHFDALKQSASFSTHSLFALAECYRLLDQPQQANRFFEALTSSFDAGFRVEDEEKVFYAACQLARTHRERSLTLLTLLATEGREKKAVAADRLFQELAHEKEWERLYKARDLLVGALPKEKLPSLHFYLGRYLLDKESAHAASDHLEKSLALGLHSPYDKNALLCLLQLYHKAGHVEKFEAVIGELHERYGSLDKESQKAELLRASLIRQQGDLPSALAILDRLCSTTEDRELYAAALLEKLTLFAKEQMWEQAHNSCLEAHALFGETPRALEMVRLAIDLSLHHLAALQSEEIYAQLSCDIERALALQGVLTREEECEHRLTLAKAYLALEKVQPAIALLEEHRKQYGEMGRTHLLLSLAYQKRGECEEAIAHGEEALRLSRDLPDEPLLHLHLFNAYVQKARLIPDEEEELTAANHLFAVRDLTSLTLDNRLWLGHTFARIAHAKGGRAEGEKALLLFTPLIENRGNWSHFEREVVATGALHRLLGEPQKERSLLEELYSRQKNDSSVAWRTTENVELALATLYTQAHEEEKAFGLYQKLEESLEPLIAKEATLRFQRLLFKRLKAEERNESSTKAQEIVRTLRSLSLRKVLVHEPFHLESALDCADFGAACKGEEERTRFLYQQLLKIKEEFTAQDDIWSKDYHGALALHPDKERLYRSYMRYLDGRVMLLEALLTKKEGNIQEGEAKMRAAFALLSTLRQSKFPMTDYLTEHIQELMRGPHV